MDTYGILGVPRDIFQHCKQLNQNFSALSRVKIQTTPTMVGDELVIHNFNMPSHPICLLKGLCAQRLQFGLLMHRNHNNRDSVNQIIATGLIQVIQKELLGIHHSAQYQYYF